MSDFGHGAAGTREQAFTELLPLRAVGYPTHLLVELSASMAAKPDPVSDGADPEENRLLPAGYTYFGQFVDHDLTFDNTSSLNPADVGSTDRRPTNLRTPRFDLDSLYGDGPDAQPFLYKTDGASLLLKDGDTDGDSHPVQAFPGQADQDLLRSPNGRAIIGDKRNDENSLINQIHLSFVKFHNAVVQIISQDNSRFVDGRPLTGTALFNAARNEVRWAYQKIVIEDFLPRIVKPEVLADLRKATTPEMRSSLYALYTEDKRINLPREFVVAAYRFGHSGVRTGYRLNTDTTRNIFQNADQVAHPKPDDSLLGFEPLPATHVIDDFGRFFPSQDPSSPSLCLGDPPQKDLNGEPIPNPDVRLQFAYKIDTTLVDPLTILPPTVLPTSPNPGGALQEVKDAIKPDQLAFKDRPSLALLNLLRGNNYRVQSGQAIAKVLKEKGFRGQNFVPIEPLDPKYLVTRTSVSDGVFKFTPIVDSTLREDTPLWFYILAEAQAQLAETIRIKKGFAEITDGTFTEDDLRDSEVAQTQLGWVGGRIVAEVFYGLMDSDKDSYVYAKDWKPIWAPGLDIFASLLRFAGQPISSTH